MDASPYVDDTATFQQFWRPASLKLNGLQNIELHGAGDLSAKLQYLSLPRKLPRGSSYCHQGDTGHRHLPTLPPSPAENPQQVWVCSAQKISASHFSPR